MLPRYVCCLISLTVLTLVLPASSARGEEPFGAGSFQAARELARKTGRIILVDFYTTWCGPCKKLDETTWKNKAVRAWLAEKAVCRKIDAEKQTALAAKYRIGAYPTILLLKPDGTEIDRLVGYRDSTTFLTEAKDALAGKDSLARARAQLDGSHKDDPMARMAYADALAQKGRYADALKEYLWCLDEGKKVPAFAGVRLSFLLNDIKQLASQYPPAKAALIQRRDKVLAGLESGSPDPMMGLEFATYNEQLGEQANTLAVYDRIRVQNAPAAAFLFHFISNQLLEQKRYSDMISGAGDVSSQVDQEIATYKMMSVNAQLDKTTRSFFVRHTVEAGGGFYEALLGTDKTVEADALRDKLLAFDASVDTYAELMRHAVRAGKPDAAQKLKETARTGLSPDAFAQLEKATLQKR